MSYEATIVCDSCGRIISAASNANKARAENREMGGTSRPPRDLCARCVTGNPYRATRRPKTDERNLTDGD